MAGRPGFEAEGNEIILTKGVHRNPVLRPFASLLNMLGGGKPLYRDPMSAALMARDVEGGVVRYDASCMATRN
ncbi:hypothetical protein EU556_11530 [Hymenobacter fodinae]|uniref:Uncharacterized protein n=1 Tax=Hymenobacter fodinae TaxID=2510796 RepID=A0A4Z0P8L1_9BACT|nr:hypothetical protein EU556_11530 [Hymenobacter fodinae]